MVRHAPQNALMREYAQGAAKFGTPVTLLIRRMLSGITEMNTAVANSRTNQVARELGSFQDRVIEGAFTTRPVSSRAAGGMYSRWFTGSACCGWSGTG